MLHISDNLHCVRIYHEGPLAASQRLHKGHKEILEGTWIEDKELKLNQFLSRSIRLKSDGEMPVTFLNCADRWDVLLYWSRHAISDNVRSLYNNSCFTRSIFCEMINCWMVMFLILEKQRER